MSKLNPQIDIAVLKEQVIQMTRSMITIQADITVINSKLDDTYVRKVDHDASEKANQDTHVNFDLRMRTQENWRYYMMGALAIMAFALVLIATLKNK